MLGLWEKPKQGDGTMKLSYEQANALVEEMHAALDAAKVTHEIYLTSPRHSVFGASIRVGTCNLELYAKPASSTHLIETVTFLASFQ